MLLSIVLFLLSIISWFIFYYKTKDLLNPLGIFLFMWYFTSFLASLYLSPLVQPWNIEMIFVVILSGFAVFIGGYLFYPEIVGSYYSVNKIKISNGFIIITRILFIVSVISLLIEMSKNNFMIAGLNFNSSIDKGNLIKAVPMFHYGVILLPYLAILSFYELKNTLKYKAYNYFVIFFSLIFYSLLINISRGDVLLILLGIMYIHHRYNPFTIKKIILIATLMCIVFVAIGIYRIPSGSMVFNSFRNSKAISKYFSAIYTYSAYNFENLRKLVDSNSKYHFFHYSLKALWKLIGVEDALFIKNYKTVFFNAKPYLYSFYHDFKLLGILIFPFIIGVIISLVYNLTYKKPIYIILLAFLQKAIFMNFFGNYFFGEFIIIWPYLICLLIIQFNKIKFRW